MHARGRMAGGRRSLTAGRHLGRPLPQAEQLQEGRRHQPLLLPCCRSADCHHLRLRCVVQDSGFAAFQQNIQTVSAMATKLAADPNPGFTPGRVWAASRRRHGRVLKQWHPQRQPASQPASTALVVLAHRGAQSFYLCAAAGLTQFADMSPRQFKTSVLIKWPKRSRLQPRTKTTAKRCAAAAVPPRMHGSSISPNAAQWHCPTCRHAPPAPCAAARALMPSPGGCCKPSQTCWTGASRRRSTR